MGFTKTIAERKIACTRVQDRIGQLFVLPNEDFRFDRKMHATDRRNNMSRFSRKFPRGNNNRIAAADLVVVFVVGAVRCRLRPAAVRTRFSFYGRTSGPLNRENTDA